MWFCYCTHKLVLLSCGQLEYLGKKPDPWLASMQPTAARGLYSVQTLLVRPLLLPASLPVLSCPGGGMKQPNPRRCSPPWETTCPSPQGRAPAFPRCCHANTSSSLSPAKPPRGSGARGAHLPNPQVTADISLQQPSLPAPEQHCCLGGRRVTQINWL